MVFFDLSWKFFKNLTGQFDSIVVVLGKLYELNEISLCLIALKISHLAVVIIQLMHSTPVLALANPNYDDTKRQFTTLNEQVFYFFLIVDDAIC